MKHFCPESGRFLDPPARPNWVSSQTDSKSHFLAPIPFVGDPDSAFSRLVRAVTAMSRATLVEQQSEPPGYLHVECRSRLFRFVDDLEFLLVPDESAIHFCSAARLGWSDLGVNHRRIEEIRSQFTS